MGSGFQCSRDALEGFHNGEVLAECQQQSGIERPAGFDLFKESVRRRIRQNKRARLRETPSTAEIVGRIVAIILVIAVGVQAVSR
jgi:hypothetical protein